MTPVTVFAVELSRLVVLFTLVAAVIGKLASFNAFREGAADLLRVEDGRIIMVIAASVVAAEAACAVLLALGGDGALIGMGGSAVLFAVFAAAVARAVFERRIVRCNCFGAEPHEITPLDVCRNFALIAACAFYLLQAPTAGEIPPNAAIMLVGPAACVAIITANLKDLGFLLSH